MFYKKIKFYLKILFFFLIFNPLYADEINCENIFLKFNFHEPQNLKKIDIEVYDARKWYLNFARIVSDRRNQIRSKYKKKFLAKVKFVYKNNIVCTLEAKIRQVGDFKDHIKFNGKNNYQSINVDLLNGNIFGITKFKLFLPEVRLGANEVFASSILSSANILSPRTYLFPTKFNDNEEILMLFQENPVKEFIEFNKKREGPIFEADEQILWDYRAEGLKDPEPLVLNRLTNKNFYMKSYSSKINSSYWYFKLQKIFKKFHFSESKYFDLIELSNGNYKYFKKFLTFEILQNVMGSDHGLIYHNRKFFANNLEDSFEPIYYDGMIEIFFNPKQKSEIFKKGKWNFSNLFYYMSKIENLSQYKSELLELFSEEKVLKIYSEVSFNTNISYEEFNQAIDYVILNINYLFNQYELNKNNIKEKKYLNEIVNYKNFVNEKFKNVIFYGVDFNKLNNGKSRLLVQECINDNCQITEKNQKFISNLILGRKVGNKKNILFEKEQLILSNVQKKSLIFKDREINFIQSDGILIEFDEKRNLVKIKKKNEDDFILFFNSQFNNIEINFDLDRENLFVNNNNKDRANEYNLTGCLNFYNSEFRGTKINVQNANCEDALNILNSKGLIEDLSISNSFADGFDADFSNLKIINLNIKNSFNDCGDFSMGNYKIINAKLIFCGDKGMSIGENSYMEIENLVSDYSNIGLASKDSSKTKVNNAEISNTKYCLSAYKKKQEFNGSIIEVNEIDCTKFYKEFEVDIFSRVKIHNKL
jgi:hypothetical protein